MSWHEAWWITRWCMPRFEKWLTIATANVPADQVARAALSERLLAVSYYLDQALRGDEAESIHQLRVWSRRASAALSLFSAAVRKSDYKWLNKTLRKVRLVRGRPLVSARSRLI